jgi:hypothetical protein
VTGEADVILKMCKRPIKLFFLSCKNWHSRLFLWAALHSRARINAGLSAAIRQGAAEELGDNIAGFLISNRK